ncbi:MAG: dlgD [Sphingobacteriaceae bacterium]|jgi:3-dehydro-L-gulonate 2-dehydrogenase|nr:dlgD [Sphingobacteriaceae bacterium]
MIGICFTNTIANVPPWGGIEPRLGNNPLVIAVPREVGNVVLDMAMSQYSYGKLHEYKAKGKELLFDGGFDVKGNLTKAPADIIESQRALPIGFWKGSGLSLMLDLLATLLSGGQSTAKITQANERETGVSQVFICFYQDDKSTTERLVQEILEYTKSSRAENGNNISYPGENTLKTRLDNSRNGIPVDEEIWERVLKM